MMRKRKQESRIEWCMKTPLLRQQRVTSRLDVDSVKYTHTDAHAIAPYGSTNKTELPVPHFNVLSPTYTLISSLSCPLS